VEKPEDHIEIVSGATHSPNRLKLAKQADAILRRARCDTVTSAKMDRQYRRDKSAERKRFARHWRAKRKRLGKFGPASPVRTFNPDDIGG